MNFSITIRHWVAVCFLSVAALGSTALAQDNDIVNQVKEVRIEGNKQLPTPAVLANIHTRAGQKFNLETLREDKRTLLKTARYAKVDVTHVRTNKGVIVTFSLTELPLVSKISITGVKSLKEEEIRKEIRLSVNDPISESRITDSQRAITEYYKTQGFHFVKVDYAIRKRDVLFRIVEGPRVVVRKIAYKGNSYFKTSSLRMKTETWRRVWPVVSGFLEMDKINRDILTIRNLYIAEGFLDVEVAPLLDYSADKSDVTLTFVIRENKRYKVSQVLFEGNKVFSDDELRNRLRLQTGDFFTQEAHNVDTQTLQTAYGELGYIKANVHPAKRFKAQAGLIDLVYKITEADQYRIGQINIRGNDVTQDRIIRRTLRFYPEQIFNTVAVKQSRSRLRELGLFDDVQIQPIGDQKNIRDILVEVREGHTANFIIGAGISSNNGLVGNISYKQRNFDICNWPKSWKEFLTMQGWKGAGQTFSIVAEPGTDLMRYSIEWFDPMLFDQPYSVGVRIFGFERDRGEYDERRIGALVSLGHRFKNRWYGELAARVEGVRIDDLDKGVPQEITDDEGSHLLVGLKGTLVRDRTDSRWTPSTGDRIRLSVEPVMGDYQFTVLTADYRWYKTLFTDTLDRKHIFAVRTSAGYIAGDAPIFERFYGGGIGSIRGFDYRGISPRAGVDPKPIGGEFMVFAGCEYSFPIVGRQIRGVVFLDTGTVEEEFEISTYRASVGMGIRWIVPMFGQVPMSFDFAAPISKDANDDTQIFSFSLGWTF